ncbi:MAG TPA: hypothetical protein DET67_09025 [Ruegeria sp.]|nr:hypothetical protein [Ruegeria sp.]
MTDAALRTNVYLQNFWQFWLGLLFVCLEDDWCFGTRVPQLLYVTSFNEPADIEQPDIVSRRWISVQFGTIRRESSSLIGHLGARYRDASIKRNWLESKVETPILSFVDNISA